MIINHISINKQSTLKYLTISDFRLEKSVHEICIQHRVLLTSVYPTVYGNTCASLQAAIFNVDHFEWEVICAEFRGIFLRVLKVMMAGPSLILCFTWKVTMFHIWIFCR